MKFDYCFVDLDDTLYNTQQFKKDMYEVFQSSGITYDEFFIAYNNAEAMRDAGYFHYTFERHIEEIKKLGFIVPDGALDKLNELLKRNYVMAGADKLLDLLKQICNKVILLTAGTTDMQAKKVDAIGLRSMFDEVVHIAGGKDELLKKYVNNGQKALFINDKLNENLVIKKTFDSVEIITLYNPIRYTVAECEANGLKCFQNLDEIINYLK